MYDYLNTKGDDDDGNTSARSLDKLDKYTSKDTYKNKVHGRNVMDKNKNDKMVKKTEEYTKNLFL